MRSTRNAAISRSRFPATGDIEGAHASELIAGAALAMKLEATSISTCSTMHAHPTLSEALMEAAPDVTGDSLHFMPLK